MRILYTLYAWLWKRLRFKLTFFGVTQALTIEDEMKCFESFIVGTNPRTGCCEILKPWVIAYYQRRFGCRVFVETGTNWGRTVGAVAHLFRSCKTIEIDPEMVVRAREHLRGKDNIEIVQGDSGQRLGGVLALLFFGMSKPGILIWLDAHMDFSTNIESPLKRELETILRYSAEPLTILIDDAGGLKIDEGYFKWWHQQMIKAGYTIELRDEIWRLHK